MTDSSDVTVDTFVQDVQIFGSNTGLFHHLRKPFWNEFLTDRVERIFEAGGLIVDIGGGLRIDGSRGNEEVKERRTLFEKYLSDPKVQYVVTDYTDEYSPDRVEDIHQLSFEDNSLDAVLCLATIEHVYDPKKACEEIARVLKPGGMAFFYAPFMYRYHAHKHDYRDYYRYSKDGWAYLLRECSSIELCPVRGIFESLLRFIPLHRFGLFRMMARLMDHSTAKMRAISQVQTSGYNVFVRK